MGGFAGGWGPTKRGRGFQWGHEGGGDERVGFPVESQGAGFPVQGMRGWLYRKGGVLPVEDGDEEGFFQ